MSRPIENAIEWYGGKDYVTVTFSNTDYINLMKKANKKFPDLCDLEINEDKSLIGHIPLSWVSINVPTKKRTTKKG